MRKNRTAATATAFIKKFAKDLKAGHRFQRWQDGQIFTVTAVQDMPLAEKVLVQTDLAAFDFRPTEVVYVERSSLNPTTEAK